MQGNARAALALLALLSAHCGKSSSDDPPSATHGGRGGMAGSAEPSAGTGAAGASLGGAAGASLGGTAGVSLGGTAGASLGGAAGASLGGTAGASLGGAAGSVGGRTGGDAGEGGAGGAVDDACPDTRPQSSTTCAVSADAVCTYGRDVCRCFTPDFMNQPPLWNCTTTGAGGSN